MDRIMKRSRFTEEQIIGILKEQEGWSFGPSCAVNTECATPAFRGHVICNRAIGCNYRISIVTY